MNDMRRRGSRHWTRLAGVLLAAVAALVLLPSPGRTQGTDPRPDWMIDSFSIFSRYLILWQYWDSDEVTKFDIWNNEGDPETALDNFTGFIENPDPNTFAYIAPWSFSRLFSSPHPPTGNNADDRVWANTVTLRVVDPDEDTGFRDLTFPDDGTALYDPPTRTLPNNQGFEAPYLFEDGTLRVTQRLQITRDLVRIEYIVRNIGGSARQVGVRLLLDSYVDRQGPTESFFVPETQETVESEADYGRRTGTTVTPRNPVVPSEWLHFDQDESPDAVFISKQILRGNGATPPTRFAFVNTLDVFPTEGVWDYATDNPQELRTADQGTLVWWDPVQVPSGRAVSFVTYAGVGVATHTMSQAYLTGQDRALNDSNPARQNETYGYVGALQAPFALPLVNGNADLDAAGGPMAHSVRAYMQNMYHRFNIPNAFAFVDLPEGLQFSTPDQTQRRDLGNLDAYGSSTRDEGQGQWLVQATGAEAGLLPINVTFSNGYGDSARATRYINVPQGRLYQFGDDWRMVTFPFTYTNGQDDPADVLGLDPGSFQLKTWNPRTSSYEDVTRVVPGVSYWIRMLGQGNTPVRLANAAPVKLSTNSTYRTQLVRGWNQVGNASPYAVPLRNLEFLLTGGLPIPLSQAIARNLVRPSIYTYNRKTAQYEQLDANSVVTPGQGVWIYSTGEQTLLWPAPRGPRISITP